MLKRKPSGGLSLPLSLVTFKVPLTDASESLLGTGPFTSRKETTLAGN